MQSPGIPRIPLSTSDSPSSSTELTDSDQSRNTPRTDAMAMLDRRVRWVKFHLNLMEHSNGPNISERIAKLRADIELAIAAIAEEFDKRRRNRRKIEMLSEDIQKEFNLNERNVVWAMLCLKLNEAVMNAPERNEKPSSSPTFYNPSISSEKYLAYLNSLVHARNTGNLSKKFSHTMLISFVSMLKAIDEIYPIIDFFDKELDEYRSLFGINCKECLNYKLFRDNADKGYFNWAFASAEKEEEISQSKDKFFWLRERLTHIKELCKGLEPKSVKKTDKLIEEVNVPINRKAQSQQKKEASRNLRHNFAAKTSAEARKNEGSDPAQPTEFELKLSGPIKINPIQKQQKDLNSLFEDAYKNAVKILSDFFLQAKPKKRSLYEIIKYLEKKKDNDHLLRMIGCTLKEIFQLDPWLNEEGFPVQLLKYRPQYIKVFENFPQQPSSSIRLGS